MFCQQCEQTKGGVACDVKGVCGKDESTANLQDLLIYAIKGIGYYAKLARDVQIVDKEVDRFVIEALFTTVTNVNFDPKVIEEIIIRSQSIKEKIKAEYLAVNKRKNDDAKLPETAKYVPARSSAELAQQAFVANIKKSFNQNDDIRSLQEILLFGLKGMAAYMDHALVLGKDNDEVQKFFHKALYELACDKLPAQDWLALIMEFGKTNLKCMETLDAAHTEHYGHPVPTKVPLGYKKGPAIILSGHDLLDLEELLKQTENKGINIYTHSEMLPGHGYPKLKKYKHFIGHFGTAWQNQQKEFDDIPAVVLMTTNCIQKPKDSYIDRIFTTGLVAFPDVQHIKAVNGKKDFTPLIKKAIELGGFKEDKIEKEILVGFAHNAVLSVAPTVIDYVKKGKIKHFFLIGGCDGAKPGRNYYTDFAQKVPKDCVILTLACGKFRFNALDFGEIEGVPRLLDCGQCNDAYSAIIIAVKLAEAFKCGVNDLPLSLVLSWYEQKAVCILLTLFSLGIKNIRLGPTLPAFVSPNILKVLVDQFNVKPITTVEQDLKDILKK